MITEPITVEDILRLEWREKCILFLAILIGLVFFVPICIVWLVSNACDLVRWHWKGRSRAL